jgi:DNA-binding ferritin-like protein
MEDEVIGNALVALADLANSVSGDFHCLHFNVQGAEFDTMHRKVLKKYYEEAADDYDELAEKSRMYGCLFPTPNSSAERIGYSSFEPTNIVNKEVAVKRSQDVIELLLSQYSSMLILMNERDCPKCQGIANFLQTRIEYWSKEAFYFNNSRGA